ncbi:hypothetical protein Metvu_0597 [Methanocaldococcus vulcanius M7]|uniref:Uncharacterized protein n=1 Tax=Methanocaldococcus vulcanius (strain ATCC 700851 / DSM 12094 / M7) TaxID=579137 RepID=C9RFV4_METVM|nr:hypothetical protein [Methanocaldococcus vulcanius]ACX72456.1 hypothetical protein Metvu_0597 [Methanocaldococcus vulcanius M7]
MTYEHMVKSILTLLATFERKNRRVLLLYEYVLQHKNLPTEAIPVIYFIKYNDWFEAYKNYLKNNLDHINDLEYNAFLILIGDTPHIMNLELYEFFLEISNFSEEQKMRIIYKITKKIKEEEKYVRRNSQYQRTPEKSCI